MSARWSLPAGAARAPRGASPRGARSGCAFAVECVRMGYRCLRRQAPGAGALLGALALAVLACGAQGPAQAGPSAPNVLLITADDLGWRDLSSYGNRDVRTPNIDRLAAEGMRFTRAFVAASSCSASRASLTTGQYPHTNGVTALTHAHPLRMLRPGQRTLADELSDAGYRTALAGKWHVAPYLPTSWYGYDERMGGLVDMWIRDIGPVLDFVRRNRGRAFHLELNLMQTHRDDRGRSPSIPRFRWTRRRSRSPPTCTFPTGPPSARTWPATTARCVAWTPWSAPCWTSWTSWS